MTIATEITKAGPFIGNGVATAFPFAYKVFGESDVLVVRQTIATGVNVTLVLDSDYSVTLNVDQDVNPGGTVNYPLIGVPMPAAQSLTLGSIIPRTQPTDLPNGGPYFASSVENMVDRAIRIDQQVFELSERALHFPITDTNSGELPSAVQRALMYMAFNAAGDPIAASGSGGTPISAPMIPVVSAISLIAARAALSVNSIAEVAAAVAACLPLAGGTLLGPLLLAGDPTVALNPATKQYVDAGALTTGHISPSLSAAAPAGSLNLQGGTIGNAASGGTVRANADTAGLFTYLWTNLSDTLAPVSGGRGGSAAADFAANKTITLPDWRNRSLIGAGQTTVAESFNQAAVNIGTDTITVASNDRRWNNCQQIVFNILTGSITGAGIANGATLWLIRTGLTTFKLATTLANAQNGTAIDITAVGGASTFSIVTTFTARTIGEDGGEEQHAISVNGELPAHVHGVSNVGPNSSGPGSILNNQGTIVSTFLNTGGAGGNAAMNIMDPFYAVNWIIHL